MMHKNKRKNKPKLALDFLPLRVPPSRYILSIRSLDFVDVSFLTSPQRGRNMAPDPAADRGDLIDRLLVGFVNVPAGVVLPMIVSVVSIMFYYFNNHMFQ